MSDPVELHKDKNLLITKLNHAVSDAVDSVLNAHSGQVTYVEVIGALELLKADYILEHQAINLAE